MKMSDLKQKRLLTAIITRTSAIVAIIILSLAATGAIDHGIVSAATTSDPSIGPSPPLFFDSPLYPGYPIWTTVHGQPALQLTPVASGAYAGVAWHALGYDGQPVEVSMNGTYTQVSGAGLADGFKIIMFAQNGTGVLRYENNSIPGLSGPILCGAPSSTGIGGNQGLSPDSTSPDFSLGWDPFYTQVGYPGQFNLWVFNPPCTLVANPGGIGCSIGEPAAFDTIRFNTTYTPDGNILQARVSDLTSGADCSFSVELSQYGFNPPSPGNYWAMILGANGGGYADWTLLQVQIIAKQSTSTTVNCSGNGLGSQCTATISDTSAGMPLTPTGTVAWSSSGSAGTFKPSSCTLSGSGSSASCTVGYAPSGQQNPVTITATYQGDTNHLGSSGSETLTAPP